jgi:hypothetical protein
MVVLARRSGLIAMLVVAVGAVLATGLFNRSEPTGIRPPAIARSGTRGVTPSSNRAIPLAPLTARPVLDRASGAIAIEIEGAGRSAIDSAELADRATNLQAADRRAWRLTELIDKAYIHSDTIIHALTMDGGDYILNDDGRHGSDVIVVRRASGELYLGWLDGSAERGRPLADAELPAERIERVARISLATPAAAPDEAPAQLTVVIDGKPRRTVTAESFAEAATLQIRARHDRGQPIDRGVPATRPLGPGEPPGGEGASSAIDVAHAFGVEVQVVALTAGGHRTASPPPSRDARAVIYLTRRARFKFAWIDARGEPIDGTKQRDVSELVLATSSPVAARH